MSLQLAFYFCELLLEKTQQSPNLTSYNKININNFENEKKLSFFCFNLKIICDNNKTQKKQEEKNTIFEIQCVY